MMMKHSIDMRCIDMRRLLCGALFVCVPLFGSDNEGCKNALIKLQTAYEKTVVSGSLGAEQKKALPELIWRAEKISPQSDKTEGGLFTGLFPMDEDSYWAGAFMAAIFAATVESFR